MNRILAISVGSVYDEPFVVLLVIVYKSDMFCSKITIERVALAEARLFNRLVGREGRRTIDSEVPVCSSTVEELFVVVV